jgi:hypothetical protein
MLALYSHHVDVALLPAGGATGTTYLSQLNIGEGVLTTIVTIDGGHLRRTVSPAIRRGTVPAPGSSDGIAATAARQGDDRNRTGVDGFAGRCVATPPRRRGSEG